MIRSFNERFHFTFANGLWEHTHERWGGREWVIIGRRPPSSSPTPPPTARSSIINQLTPDEQARISGDETQSVPSVEWWQHIDSDCLTAKRVTDSGIIFTCAFISSNILPEFLSTWLLKSSSANSACWACCFWTSESFCTWSSRSL